MSFPARIVLFALGMGIAALESDGFKQEPTWISAVGGILILVAFFASRD